MPQTLNFSISTCVSKSMFSTWTVRVVLTLSLVRLPVALSLVTFLTVLARTLSPSWMRLKACHMSSDSSGIRASTPAPSRSRDLWTSFILAPSASARSSVFLWSHFSEIFDQRERLELPSDRICSRVISMLPPWAALQSKVHNITLAAAVPRLAPALQTTLTPGLQFNGSCISIPA